MQDVAGDIFSYLHGMCIASPAEVLVNAPPPAWKWECCCDRRMNSDTNHQELLLKNIVFSTKESLSQLSPVSQLTFHGFFHQLVCMMGSNHTQFQEGSSGVHDIVPVSFLLFGQWLCEPKEVIIVHRVVSLCLAACITTEEVGDVGIWRTSVPKVIDHVLFHHKAKPKPWQAGEIRKVLDDSSDSSWIWTVCPLQLCNTWHFPASDVPNFSPGCAERWGCGALLSKAALT